MTKKSFDLAGIIIHIIILVLLFADGTYKMVGKSVYGSYKGSTLNSFVDCTINSSTTDNPVFPIGWIFIALVSVSLIILFIEILDIKKFDKKLTLILSAMSLILFLAISIYIDYKSGGTYEYNGDLRRSHLEMGIVFYVNVVLLLLAASLRILKED